MKLLIFLKIIIFIILNYNVLFCNEFKSEQFNIKDKILRQTELGFKNSNQSLKKLDNLIKYIGNKNLLNEKLIILVNVLGYPINYVLDSSFNIELYEKRVSEPDYCIIIPVDSNRTRLIYLSVDKLKDTMIIMNSYYFFNNETNKWMINLQDAIQFRYRKPSNFPFSIHLILFDKEYFSSHSFQYLLKLDNGLFFNFADIPETKERRELEMLIKSIYKLGVLKDFKHIVDE